MFRKLSRKVAPRASTWLKAFAVMAMVSIPMAAYSLGKKPHHHFLGHTTIFPISLLMTQSPFDPEIEDDRNGNGMNDEAEHLLAKHFRPYYVFDSRENVRLASEPLTLYQVHTGQRRGGIHGRPKTVKITYAYLFADDGGYEESFFCGDRHKGDNQSLSIEVQVDPTGHVFSLTKVDNGNYHWPEDRMDLYHSQHPVIYLSAGKHHPFFDTAFDKLSSPYSAWGCIEGMDGQGVRVLANLESIFAPNGHLNVGESFSHPSEHFVNDLTFLGFFRESAWGNRPFCGGHLETCGDVTSPMAALWD